MEFYFPGKAEDLEIPSDDNKYYVASKTEVQHLSDGEIYSLITGRQSLFVYRN